VKEKGKTYWLNREKRELVHKMEGPLHVFVEPEGMGYVRVARTDENQCIYMEHLVQGMATITYWGVSVQCSLP